MAYCWVSEGYLFVGNPSIHLQYCLTYRWELTDHGPWRITTTWSHALELLLLTWDVNYNSYYYCICQQDDDDDVQWLNVHLKADQKPA